MGFINGSESPVPFSERKLQGGDDAPWSFEDIVDAQRMECDGVAYPAIAAELGRSLDAVMKALGATPAPARTNRPERANVGFATHKERR